MKRNSAPASLVSKYITGRPLDVRVRMSPISAVSRPILALRLKLRTRPLRRDIRKSRPRSASPWCPATTPTLISRSMSVCLPLFFGSVGGPDIDDFTKVRPSYTSPRSTTRSAPSDARSARNVTLSPSEVANTGKFAVCMSPLASSSTLPRARIPGPSISRSLNRIPALSLMKVKVGARRAARRLDPSRQQAVDLERREIGLDVEAAGFGVADAAVELERQQARDGAAEVQSEPGARRVVERRRQTDLGLRLAGDSAVLDLRRRAADPHVAPDIEFLVVGVEAQRLRLDRWLNIIFSALKFATSATML